MITITQSMLNNGSYYYPGPGDYLLAPDLYWPSTSGIAIQPDANYPLTGLVRFWGQGAFTAEPWTNTTAIGICTNGHDVEMHNIRFNGFQQGALILNGANANASHLFESVAGRCYLHTIKAIGVKNSFINCLGYKAGGSGHSARPAPFWNEGIDPRLVNCHSIDTERLHPYETETIGFNIVGAGENGYAINCSVANRTKHAGLSWGWWFNRVGSTPHSFRIIEGYFDGQHCIFGGDLDGGDLGGRKWNCDYIVPSGSWATGKTINVAG